MASLSSWLPADFVLSNKMTNELLHMMIMRNLENVLPDLEEKLEARDDAYLHNLLEQDIHPLARRAILDRMTLYVPVWEYPLTTEEKKEYVNRAAITLFANLQDEKHLILEKLKTIPLTQEILNAAVHYRCPLEVVTWLLDSGLSVHHADEYVGTPLMWACRPGFANQGPDPDVLQLLLDRGSDPTLVHKGMTPMAWCDDTPAGHKAMQVIYTAPKQVNAELRAVLRGGRRFREFNADRVRVLVKLGADVNLNMETSHDEHITPLMFACHNGRVSLIHLLLDLGADKSIRAVKDDKDSTAFTFYLNYLVRGKRSDPDTLERLQ